MSDLGFLEFNHRCEQGHEWTCGWGNRETIASLA
jgi:hypothetical protein